MTKRLRGLGEKRNVLSTPGVRGPHRAGRVPPLRSEDESAESKTGPWTLASTEGDQFWILTTRR